MSEVDRSTLLGSIKFLKGPLAGRTFLIRKPITTIGRLASNDVAVLGDLRVSREHARVLWNNGIWAIENLSSNKLYINQREVQQGQTVELTNEATIDLGPNTSFLFQSQVSDPSAVNISRPAPSVNPQQPTPPSGLPSSPPFSVSPPPTLPSSPQSFPVPTSPQVFNAPPSQPFSPTSPLRGPTGGSRRPDETQIAPLSELTLGQPLLEVSSNAYGGKGSYPINKPVIDIGRDATNDLVINDRIVSGRHLQIRRENDQFVLYHPHPDNPRRQTVNGLLYQGRKIRGDEYFRHELRRGDIFRIGDENGTLITLAYNDGSGTQEQMLPPVQPIKLGATELTIGRRPENTVVLNHPQVSAHHARLVREGGTYRVLDLNSTNHVYVNSQLTTSHLLKLGDEIRIGPYRLIYEANQLTQYDESNFIRIDALNLKKTGNNNITLLNNITLSIPPRKFVALVGGSGAGKSTLMDALNGLRPAQEGKVLYNGQDYYRNLAAFSTQLGYVPQDDIVHRDLTVERALYYAAKLRLPSDFTEAQIQQRINDVLEDVEMTRRRHLMIKKVSGGQRKRVSIALELLANPSIFFLDEPTSGLDPGLDRKMMYLLRKLADKGHTIVLVTHATNNINTCDYVCFLGQGGRVAYFGPPDDAKAYFGKTDFAEVYTSLEPTDENPNIPEEAEARFKVSQEYQRYVVQPLREEPTGPGASDGRGQPKLKEIKRPKRGNPLKQFILLSQRNLELLKNNRVNLIILILQAPIIALFLMLLVRFEVGVGIFDANKVIQCQPQIFVSAPVSATNPSGTKTIGINTKGKIAAVDCQKIVNYLKTNADGIPNADGTANTDGTAYAQQKGGVNKALQDFITLGNVNAQRALFIIAFVAVLFGCINGTREIVKEASIYRRERTVNLGIAPYIFSKIFVLVLFALFQSAALLLIVNAFEPLHQGIFLPPFLENYITIVLSAFAGLMVGLTTSAFADSEDTANSMLPFILIPQVIFAGVEIPLKDLGLQIPAVIFPTRWAMVALGSSIGVHADKVGGDSLFGSDTAYHGTLFSTFSQVDATHRLLLAWAALGAIIVVLIILTGIALKRKDTRV